MKLEDVHIGVSALTDDIYVGTLKAPDEWRHKVNRTNAFISALLVWCPPGYEREVATENGERYVITCKQI